MNVSFCLQRVNSYECIRIVTRARGSLNAKTVVTSSRDRYVFRTHAIERYGYTFYNTFHQFPFPQAHLRRHALVHKRTENYNPKQRKFRNVIVDDLEDTTGIMASVKIVQASLKKKKIKKKVKKKKKPKSKTFITTEEDTGDSFSNWIPSVDCQVKKKIRKTKKKESLKKTEELEHEMMEEDLGHAPIEAQFEQSPTETGLAQEPVETEQNAVPFESTVDMSQIQDQTMDNGT